MTLKSISAKSGTVKSMLNRALYLLSLRDHSELELRRKLVVQSTFSKGFQRKASCEPEDNIALVAELERVVQYCLEHGWLDDAKYAQRFIVNRSNKGYGAQRIRMELIQRGITEERICYAMELCEIDWLNLANDLAVRRFGLPLPVEWQEKAKVLRYLLYRGFSHDEISSIFP